MRASIILVILMAAGALGYFGLKWQAGNGVADSGETALALGAEIFAANCSACHGENMIARGDAPDLRLFSRGEEDFRMTVRSGFYPMPSFEGEFTEDELAALWAYVSSDVSS